MTVKALVVRRGGSLKPPQWTRPEPFFDEAVRLLAARWNDLPRHDTTMALAGTLARAGWHLPDAP